jgi:hypothetical protein
MVLVGHWGYLNINLQISNTNWNGLSGKVMLEVLTIIAIERMEGHHPSKPEVDGGCSVSFDISLH